jgi:Peptidase family C25
LHTISKKKTLFDLMKKIIYLATLLLTSFCFSQQKGTVVINWSSNSEFIIGETKINVPQFQSENYQLDSYTKELFFSKKIASTFLGDEKSLEISNLETEIIPENILGDLDRTKIPSRTDAKIINNYARNEIIVSIQIPPIIKEGNLYKRVKSFSYSFNNKAEVANRNINNITNSVLAEGEWFRFYIEKSGVYKISRSFLRDLGITIDNVNPQKIKLYGNGGRMVPLKNNVAYPEDLSENAIQIIGEEDGVFNESDYILFYGEGVDNWSPENLTNGNLYSDKSFYYITYSGTDGRRIVEAQQPSALATQIITEFDDTQFHEIDKVNIIKLGRTWFGEEFNTTNVQEFPFTIPNIVIGSNIKIEVHLAATSPTSSTFKIEANGQLLNTSTFTAVNSGRYPDENLVVYPSFPATENVSVKLTFNNNGVPIANGFLDYINLTYKKQLKGYNKQFRFQNNATSNTNIKEYQIINSNAISQVWDITDINNATKYSATSQSVFSFKSDFASLRKYIAIDNADFLTPLKDSQTKIANQNIKGNIFKNEQGLFQDIDYLIFTPEEFYNEAEKLANFHRSYSQLNTKVITVESVYPEFSSGKQDIGAIRNLVRYVYNNASTPDRKVKYINLFGDASYDFKKRISKNTNFVPIYHAKNSYTISESSFACDDFYGLMDDTEGDLDAFEGILDIAVGRMIANTKEQAEELVNKVIDYHDYKSYGNWRNNFVVIADDSDAASDDSLQDIIDSMANEVVQEKPTVNVKKILLDSYTQETAAGGKRYPQARKDMFNAFETGALVFNYLGHGGEDGLAQERIWEKIDGQSLKNRFKYPLFITITCDFSRFDNPLRETAGEFTFWNPKGGAIGMITTVREISQFVGEGFNKPLAKYIYGYGTNQSISIAESLRLAKKFYTSGPTRIVAFLGDPALQLALPKPKIRVTKINDIPITQPIDDFKALSLIKLNGEVTDENDNFLSNYNGEVAIQIFDKNIIRSTLNNDGVSPAINFTTLGETIFRGNASVVNGNFELSFVVPRDISIPLGNGKISFYAKRKTILLDKTGVDTSIKIGGVNLNAPEDNTPPTVKLYMNDQTFVNGGNTNESPIFLAFLDDENGINTASGIGHDIVAILDGDENNPYKLNDYYETELDNYKKGKVKFPFRDLALGLHTITFKAFDVYNNPVIAEIQFVVVGNESITLTNVLNYPNPCVNYTQFWFTHNRPFEPLDVQIQIMTITGKIIWSKNQVVNTEGFLSREITWDGKDDFGDKIGKGVYIYKLSVKSTITNTKTEKYEKLVIL